MALTADVEITRFGVPGDAHQTLPALLGANVTIYRGSIALQANTGYLKNAASPASTDTCLGLIDAGGPGYPNFSPGIVNGSSVSGTIYVDIATGSFYMASDGTLTQANVGGTVYVSNETTVTATQGSNPKAGVLIYIDASPPPTALGGYVVKFNVVGGP